MKCNASLSITEFIAYEWIMVLLLFMLAAQASETTEEWREILKPHGVFFDVALIPILVFNFQVVMQTTRMNKLRSPRWLNEMKYHNDHHAE